MYYMAEQLMKRNQAFILESNFENASKEKLMQILERYGYQAITVRLTGDYQKIYQRFLQRETSLERHRGHVVNDCYPEKEKNRLIPPIPYEAFAAGIQSRGMDCFAANGPQIVVDMTDFDKFDLEMLVDQICDCREEQKKK